MATKSVKPAPIRPPMNNRLIQDIEQNFDAAFRAINSVVSSAAGLPLDLYFTGYNLTGSKISKGVPVYVSGGSATGDGSFYPTIAAAKADAAATMPAYGITNEDILTGTTGQVRMYGRLDEVDTSAFAAGDLLYVSAATAGALTATKPTGTNEPQGVAVVINVSATDGTLMVHVASSEPVATHNILSATHSDTTAATLLSQDLLMASGTPVTLKRYPPASSSGITATCFFGHDGTNWIQTTIATNFAINVSNATAGTLVRARGGTDQSGGSKGDLLVGNVLAWGKLAVGANGTVVEADSTQTLGVIWQTRGVKPRWGWLYFAGQG